MKESPAYLGKIEMPGQERMSESSASSTEMQSDNEDRADNHEGLERHVSDPEKQGGNGDGALARTRTRDSNSQALPGVQLDENGLHDSVEHTAPWKEQENPRRGESGREGIAGAIERVISRTSTKSNWNPGPPPDGGVKAWTAGE